MPRIRLLPDQLTADLRIVCSHCRHEFVRDQAWLQRNSHALSCPKCGRLFAKSYEDSRPQTWCRLTAEGKRRYVRYLAVLEQIVQDSAAKNLPGVTAPAPGT